jgi:hypothetical protein
MKTSNAFTKLVCVRYVNHVLFNRTVALEMKPQIRVAVGWLVYECEQYLTIAWDCDDQSSTLQDGQLKASGLVLLKTAILALNKLNAQNQAGVGLDLNCKQPTKEDEYALRPTERKT